MHNLELELLKYQSVTLSEMDRVKLMNRTDTKFAFTVEQLLDFLPAIEPFYSVLQINDIRTPRYESLYFDDQQFSFFRDHHNGKTDRFKVRIRKYVESNILFLEIKHKFKGRTDKKRITTSDFDLELDDIQKKFLNKHLDRTDELIPTMWNSFQRITLVHKKLNERLTLDFNIEFHHDNVTRKFDRLIIAELKQEDLNRNSEFYQLMKNHLVRPYRLSKYCLGSIELYGEEKLKFNRFKKKLLYLKKINDDNL